MDFFLKHLEETLEAINKLIENNINIVNTKRIRRCYNIKPSDRSKINFIWRTLKYLAEHDKGILQKDGKSAPLNYKIIPKEKIDVKEFIDSIKKKIE